MGWNRIIAGLFWAGLCVGPQPVIARDTIEEVEGRGLIIRSEPSGAKVYVDGVERGLTPLILGNLPGGEYNIRLHKDNYADRRFKVTLRPSSRLVISVDLETIKGEVSLTIRRSPGGPTEAQLPLEPVVTADGGTVTGSLIRLPVGYRTIQVRAFGWTEMVKTVYVEERTIQSLVFEMIPAPFVLRGAAVSRDRFNPGNAGSLGTTEISFEVSGPGWGRVIIRNGAGEEVFAADPGPFTTWSQKVRWNGRDPGGNMLPEGSYEVSIEAAARSEGEPQRLFLPVVIDSSIDIHPLSIASGIAGLLFAPVPEAIPPGAFQIDGALLFGKAPVTENAWDTLPFAAAFRFSPLKRLEVAAALNVTPEFKAGAVLGAAGSAKWVFRTPDPVIPVAVAAAFSFAWAQEGALSPFGMGSGAEFAFPLSWRFLPPLSLVISPALIWTGEKGYPSEAAPRGILSGGLFFRRPFISAGLSLRSEYIFAGDLRGIGPLTLGGEVQFFPPPSSLVFSLMGGGWFRGSEQGAFGGVGIGLIY